MKLVKKVNLEKVLIIYLLIQPILDVATSWCIENVNSSLTIGILVRTLFMGIIIIYSLLKSDKKTRKISFIYYLITAIYMCIFLFNLYRQNGTNMILTQIKGLIKTFYYPLTLVAIYGLLKSSNTKISNKYFIWTLAEYCIVIIAARIAGIAYNTYEYGENAGTVGIFHAANEIGAILSIISPILFIDILKNDKPNIINILILIMFVFSVLEIGTKVPFIAFVLIFTISMLICFVKIFTQKNKKKYIRKTIGLICIAIMVIIIIPYTPVGKNFEKNYNIKFMKIIKYKDLEQLMGKDKGLEIEPSTDPVIDPVIDPDKPENINVSGLISGRDTFLKNNLERYKEYSIVYKIFGTGYLSNEIDELNQFKANKLVEIDYFDILFAQGIFGFLLVFIPLGYIIAKMLVITIKNLILVLKNEELNIYWYAIAISLGIAMVAGHVLTAPAVSIFIIYIAMNLNKELQEIRRKI